MTNIPDKDFGVVYKKENSDVRVKVTISTFNARTYLHIREYGLDGDTGRLYPLPKGIALDCNYLESLLETLKEANDHINSNALPELKQLTLFS